MVRILSVPARLAMLATIAGCALAHPAGAQSSDLDYALYQLGDYSSFNVGCYGPCDCAIRSLPLGGTFHLRKTSVDPLYTHYAVEDLLGTIQHGSQAVTVTGRGEYRIGGEFALMHQLTLDLLIGDSYPQSFDSGLVPGGADFPAIRIEVAAHGFACYDTVIGVAAKPATTGVPGPSGPGAFLRAVPNPFRSSVELRLQAPLPEAAVVDILDSQGRQVRSLPPVAPAIRVVGWDGRGQAGAAAAPGVYFARVRAPGEEWAQRIVKLK